MGSGPEEACIVTTVLTQLMQLDENRNADFSVMYGSSSHFVRRSYETIKSGNADKRSIENIKSESIS